MTAYFLCSLTKAISTCTHMIQTFQWETKICVIMLVAWLSDWKVCKACKATVSQGASSSIYFLPFVKSAHRPLNSKHFVVKYCHLQLQAAAGEQIFGVAHIFASFNDTFVHVTDISGR